MPEKSVEAQQAAAKSKLQKETMRKPKAVKMQMNTNTSLDGQPHQSSPAQLQKFFHKFMFR